MTTLEKRFYPRQEIAEIVGITNLKDKHFAEKVKRYQEVVIHAQGNRQQTTTISSR